MGTRSRPDLRVRHLVQTLGQPRQPQEGEISLFRGLGRRLTLLYTGALLLALALFGTSVYLIAARALLDPVDSTLAQRATQIASLWGMLPPFGCPRDEVVQHEFGTQLYACYNASGMLQTATPLAGTIPAFTDASLARQALHGGTDSDTAQGGRDVGSVRRYALPVTSDGSPVGVIVVGETIGGEEHALAVLLRTLLALGFAVVVAGALGGLLLTDRALGPARLAFRRQREFVADAAHELRTPLTLLRADAEVLLRGRQRLPPEDAELLEDIVAETAHMSALTSSMLRLAGLDSGETHMEPEVVNLGELAAEIVRRTAALAEERGVSVCLEVHDRILTIGDRLLLAEAVLALVDNAIKYNRPGGNVTVRVGGKGGRAVVTVSDTGIGVAPEHLRRLGERFYRVDKARSRETGGAGLGLSIVRRIAAQHGGRLEIRSESGQGTDAYLLLPAV